MQLEFQRWTEALLGTTDGFFWDEQLWEVEDCVTKRFQSSSSPVSGLPPSQTTPVSRGKKRNEFSKGWGEVVYFYHFWVIQIVKQKKNWDPALSKCLMKTSLPWKMCPKWLFQRLWNQNSCILVAVSKWLLNSPATIQVPGAPGQCSLYTSRCNRTKIS